MRKNPETVAWIIMTFSFVACVVLAIGIPYSTRWLVFNATRSLKVQLEPREGIVTFQSKGHGPLEVTTSPEEVFSNSKIVLSTDDAEALLLFYREIEPDTPVSTLQLYGETDVTFSAARTPYFECSELPHRIALQVNASKKLRVSVGGNGRAAVLQIETPQGSLELAEGSYTLVVDAQRTEIIVSKGRARVPDPQQANNTVILTDSQLTELTAAGRGKVLSSQSRDVLRNGDFSAELDPYWLPFTHRKQYNEESDGSIRRTEDGRQSIIFERAGVGHIEVGISQQVNQNIEGAQSLRLSARLKVSEQEIPVCGVAGTECPVMLRLTYRDVNGGEHEWLQGFYALAGDGYSNTCTICEGSPQHIPVPQEAWYPYTSPNLLPLLRKRGTDPATILDIEIYASGHSFISMIDEIAILVEE